MHTDLFAPGDVDAVAALFTAAAMNEMFTMPGAMSADVLLRDGQGRHVHFMPAAARRPAVAMSREP